MAVAGLTELGEIAVPQLLDQIDDYNYGARAYSIRTLAAIADPRALDILTLQLHYRLCPQCPPCRC